MMGLRVVDRFELNRKSYMFADCLDPIYENKTLSHFRSLLVCSDGKILTALDWRRNNRAIEAACEQDSRGEQWIYVY
jgi:hypothetical protein